MKILYLLTHICNYLVNIVVVIYIALSFLPMVSVTGSTRDTVQVIKENIQKSFPATVPAGNYSGIAYIGNNEYVVVDDKSKTDGFHLFTIELDSVSGEIRHVVNHGFNNSGFQNCDGEGIAYVPSANTVLISSEADGKIKEYTIEGVVTGREAMVPDVFNNVTPNMGFEALGYSDVTHRLWTCNESTLNGDGQCANPYNKVRNRLRIQSFDDSLQAREQYVYLMDAPIATGKATNYAMGVAAITAMADGSLLLLEREFFVSPLKVGSFVNCKLYQAWPEKSVAADADITRDDIPLMDKHLITEWKTTLNVFKHAMANYEGMCMGPKLSDGSRVLVLVADSQNQYAGVLKDWFKTIVIR